MGFLKEASVTFIDKTDRKYPEKENILDASIKDNEPYMLNISENL